MKKYVLLVRVLLVVLIVSKISAENSSAQTLVFNRAMVFNSTTPLLVPVNKVWKIENENNPAYTSSIYNPQYQGCSYGTRIDMFFSIDGKPNYTQRFMTSSASLSQGNSRSAFPIWLPAGTSLSVDCSDHQLFIIEFNIGP